MTMDDQSIFDREQDTVQNAAKLLTPDAVSGPDWPIHYEQLLNEYVRLLRQTEKLVRISDMMQNRLNKLNAELEHHRRVAEDANKAKSQFLAMMSHDIRNPMAAVAVMTDLLLQTDLTSDQMEYLSDIKTASNSLVGLLDELLDFSRIEAGKLELVCADFGIWDCIGDALRAAAIAAHDKPVELCTFIERDVPFRGVGDCGRLGQVLMNLLSNAVKFTDKGEISVRVEAIRRDSAEVVLHCSVTDSGIGISSENLDSIFREFEQADNEIQRKYGGSGLGLAICAKLVKGLGGRIWVESEKGKGSTFHFTAPVLEAPDALTGPTCESFARIAGLRILVASHVPIIRRSLEEFLRSWHMQATSVSTGQEALEATARARKNGGAFDLFLIDGSMPEMASFQLVSQLVNDSAVDAKRIITLVTLDSRSQSVAATHLGVHRLPKPPRLLELLSTIAQAVGENACGRCPVCQPSEEEPQHDEFRLNILVAEDNPINRILAVRMLEKMGQRVCSVEDGEAVLHALKEDDFDIILMDVEMPHKDGLETTKAIREQECGTGRHMPIIASTAHVREEDRQRFLEAGMDGCISKPIDWKQLLETMKSIR